MQLELSVSLHFSENFVCLLKADLFGVDIADAVSQFCFQVLVINNLTYLHLSRSGTQHVQKGSS